MLKRKQKRSGFSGYGFLLLATPGITGLNQDTIHTANYFSKHQQQQITVALFADTTVNKSGATDSTHSLASHLLQKKTVPAPVVRLNSYAVKFVSDYVKNNASYLEEIKEKRGSVFSIMDTVFTAYQLPVELKYLAVVESELKSKARSHVGAVGMWQLMPGTAKMLGLKVSAQYDERRLCYKSTKAAAKYLNSLYKQFGDWLLVIAAYNSGPGPVYAAIKKSGSRNFWRLQHYLPAETKKHVKRFVGTHYYFEGKGSIATLTKAEASEYLKAMDKYLESQTVASIDTTAVNDVPIAAVQ